MSKLAPCPPCSEMQAAYCRELRSHEALSVKYRNLQRENEKYRRKLAKLVYLREHPMPPTQWWNRSTGFLDLFGDDDISLRADAFVSALVYRRNAEGDGLRRYLAWQDAFVYTLKVESPALEPGVMLALAPSQKIDFSGIEDLAVKGKP